MQAIEQLYFADPAVFERVEQAEHALIDDFLEQRLTRAELDQFEAHFLAALARAKRVAIARALRETATEAVLRDQRRAAFPSARLWLAVAASIAVAAVLWFVVARPAPPPAQQAGPAGSTQPTPQVAEPPAPARELYEAAHKTLTPAGFPEYVCTTEERLGRLALHEGRNDLAEAHFQRALGIGKELPLASCEAQAYAALADAAAGRGDLDAAEHNARIVVDLTNRFRDAVAGLDARSFGFPELAPVFERAVDVTMRRGEGDPSSPSIAAGLALNEQALARGLLDALSAERIEKRADIHAEFEVKRRRLREAWRTRALEHEAAVRRRDAKRRAQLAEEMTTLSAQLREVESRIDLTDPRHASFVRPARSMLRRSKR